MLTYISNIVIPAGTDYTHTFVYIDPVSKSPVNFSGYYAKSMLKKSPHSLNFTAEFEVSIDDTEITILLPSNITSELKSGRYSYDILVNDGDSIYRIFQGSAIVSGAITINPYPIPPSLGIGTT